MEETLCDRKRLDTTTPKNNCKELVDTKVLIFCCYSYHWDHNSFSEDVKKLAGYFVNTLKFVL